MNDNSVDMLIVGDIHAMYEYPNTRMEWLGEFLIDSQVDVIAQMGDFADMPSLSSYDKGKRSNEGKRVVKDIAAAHDALEKMFTPLHKYNDRARSQKRKQYQPYKVILGGNHDFRRIDRATNDDSIYEGLITSESLRYAEYFDDVIPFLKPIEIAGIGLQHYWTDGHMDKTISSVNQCRTLLDKLKMSVIQGHTHTWEYTKQVDGMGKPIFALIAGCYFDFPPEAMSYATPKLQQLWDRSVTILRGVKDGMYTDIEKISLDSLKSMYSKCTL